MKLTTFYHKILRPLTMFLTVCVLSSNTPYVHAQSADCEALFQTGQSLYQRDQWQEALMQYESALSCYRGVANRLGELNALYNIGHTYYALGQSAEMLTYFEDALVIAQEIGDRDNELNILFNVGVLLNNLGKYENALEYLGQTSALAHEMGNLAQEGVTLEIIGHVYYMLEQPTEMLAHYEYALSIARGLGEQQRQFDLLTRIGVFYGNQNQYAEALEYLKQALDIASKMDNREYEIDALNRIGNVLDILNNLSSQYNNERRFFEALEYLELSMLTAREVGDTQHEVWALVLINAVYLNRGYAGQGSSLEAVEPLERLLSIAREEELRFLEATMLWGIGVVYFNNQQYAHALEYFEHSLLILRQESVRRDIDYDPLEEGVVLGLISQVYGIQGRYAEALEYQKQALALYREFGDQDGEADALRIIGILYFMQQQYAESLEHCKQALIIERELDNQWDEASTLMCIGSAYSALDLYNEALEQLEQALAIQHEGYGLRDLSYTLIAISRIYVIQEHTAETLNYLEQAVENLRAVNDRVGEAEALNFLGQFYDAQGDSIEAQEYYERAISVLETVRTTMGSEAGRASFIARYAAIYDSTVSLYHVQGQDAQAFFTSERGRARALLDALATGYVQLSDTAADLYAREVEAYAARQAAQQALIQARVQWPDDTALLADLEAQLTEAEADYEAALAAIIARSDQLAALVPGRSRVLELSQVQMHLDDETVLVAYWVLRDENRVLAFVITRDAFHTVVIDMPYDDLAVTINDFRNFSSLEATHPSSLVQLYDWLIAPLREYLVMPHLAIIPHDVLHYLPFAALTDGEHFLVEDYVITYLPSASALPFIQENAGHADAPTLILGNPTTGDYDATASFATERDGLGPLPFAEREAQAVAALYGAPAYVGTEATEGLVRQMAGESGILHLAAHGKYNPVAPLSSLIALAPDDEHDGWLTVGEVYGLDLQQANLVVLSACETQLGDLSAGDELVGMTRAFIYAGTPTVIASLWTVEDQATAQLMEHFYTHLRAGMGKAAALRQAQLDIQAEYPNPYYWAAFVLSGDGGEVRADAVGGRFTPDARTSRWIWLGGGTALCASLGCFGGVGLLLIVVWATRKEKRRG